MLTGSNNPMGSHAAQSLRESSLMDLGEDRAIEVLSGILGRAFPVAESEPDEEMRCLLVALSCIERTA